MKIWTQGTATETSSFVFAELVDSILMYISSEERSKLSFLPEVVTETNIHVPKIFCPRTLVFSSVKILTKFEVLP